MACTECHSAKVRCDKQLPCSRCVRLSLSCVKHVSRQGQGRKKRQRRNQKSNPVDITSTTSTACSLTEAGLGGGARVSEDGCLLAELSTDETTTRHSNHYGILYLIRSWISFAFTRRSFSLLERASSMALRLNISMDSMLCETDSQRGMDFLHHVLLVPAQQQQLTLSTLPKLQWTEVPSRLLEATGCPLINNDNLADRWVFIREMKKGLSRYLVSPAFERDIAPRSLLEDTWQANQYSVAELFVQDLSKFTRAIAHQISLHTTDKTNPQCSRMTGIPIRLLKSDGSREEPTEVDQVSCMDIVNLDHAFLFIEYIRRHPTPTSETVAQQQPSQVSAAAAPQLPPATVEPSSTESMEIPFFNLDDVTNDGDLEFFLDLLK